MSKIEVGQLWNENEHYVWEIVQVEYGPVSELPSVNIRLHALLDDEYRSSLHVGYVMGWGNFNPYGWDEWQLIGTKTTWEVIYGL